jgi:hypothetical protein
MDAKSANARRLTKTMIRVAVWTHGETTLCVNEEDSGDWTLLPFTFSSQGDLPDPECCDPLYTELFVDTEAPARAPPGGLSGSGWELKSENGKVVKGLAVVHLTPACSDVVFEVRNAKTHGTSRVMSPTRTRTGATTPESGDARDPVFAPSLRNLCARPAACCRSSCS